jgi:proline iminopeptidase
MPFRRTLLLLLLACLAGCIKVPPTVTQDATLPQVQLNGHRFHAEALGAETAPVLIVLHGGPGLDYRYLLGLGALADRYRVVFYDQLGSGLSERVPAASIDVDSFIADLDAVVAHYGHGRPVQLLGHSWGAMLAAAYAGAHPDKVERLVLAEPGFLDAGTQDGLTAGGWPGWHAVAAVSLAWLGKWRVSTDGDPQARDDWFLQRAMLPTLGADEFCDGRRTEVLAWRAGSSVFEATIGRMQADPDWGRHLDFTRGLSAWRGRALFLHGACNTAQGEAHQRRMMARFPATAQTRLVTIEGAGHLMFNDQPELSLAAVRDFLADTASQSKR